MIIRTVTTGIDTTDKHGIIIIIDMSKDRVLEMTDSTKNVTSGVTIIIGVGVLKVDDVIQKKSHPQSTTG